MTATDELRRMLDERGVKYSYECVTEGTLFVVTRDVRIYYILAREKGFEVWSNWLTPEQAIAVTLGSCNCSDNCTNSERTETCYDTGESRIFHCSECGLGLDDVFIDDEEYYPFADFPRFCPNCGAKVVGSTTNDVGAEVDA